MKVSLTTNMATLLPDDGVLYETTQVAPSPSKDFWQLKVTLDEVVVRWWKISLRTDAKVGLGQKRHSYEDFLDDYKLHSDIQMVFGENILDYVIGLANGQIDYISRLPDQVLMHIVEYLALDDIGRLALASKQFNQICLSDELWMHIYTGAAEHRANRSQELESLASQIGWRQLYFTNKLQLQVLLHRHRRKFAQSDSKDSETEENQ